MKEIKLELTIDEINVILEALGQMPFQQVYNIIHKIHQQANSQLGQDGDMKLANPE